MINISEKLKEFERFGSVLGLDRMNKLLDILGNPQNNMKVIHVAGTNGKGSICHYIYSALLENGYKTGMFISPYIESFNERIQFDGSYITDEDLDKISDEVIDASRKMVAEGYDSPTEFEIITAIAFTYFQKKNADVIILEVGLGGSGDSTNVITKPIMTIIGSISMDHMDRLGDTIQKIAMEKAGIIKPYCPLITAINNKEAFEVVAKVAEFKKAPFVDANATAERAQLIDSSIDGLRYNVKILGEEYDVETSMTGDFQLLNSVTALAALEFIRGRSILRLNKKNILDGIKKAFNPGRLEVVSKNPIVILDGAHNEYSSYALRESLASELNPEDIMQNIVVTSIMHDKEVEKILQNFIPLGNRYFVTEANNLRASDAECLKKNLMSLGVDGEHIEVIKSPYEAVSRAFKEIGQGHNSGLLVAGSLYLIGEVRNQVIEEVRNLEL
ncbi:MAG: folylpolyglutamate synthase/dihydrofolate synthase family protein [Anaerovoracaceae bacterium]|nr:folylpolyglutamate synthase/dihydrofolate synthase family protein [Anaerovoracaceae bacterium]